MKILKGILSEELVNARQKLRVYEKELARLPKGSIVSKRIKGHLFHYLAYRKGQRMVFKYHGKLSDKDLEKFRSIKKQRVQFRGYISEMKKQIRYLERILKGRKRRKDSL
jgi:hypothetical protein